jgi:hypothetical protein
MQNRLIFILPFPERFIFKGQGKSHGGKVNVRILVDQQKKLLPERAVRVYGLQQIQKYQEHVERVLT